MQEEDIYYNNGNFENDNERYRENMNMNRFYNPNENYNMNKRENININNIMINENIRQTRQNFNDNIGLMFNRNSNQIQEPKENNAQYQPQNTNYHQSIPPDINPNYHQNRVPNFIPILVGIPIHLDSRLPFQNNLGLPPNLISQIPAPNYLSQNQIMPNMVPYQMQNNQSRFEIRENNEINRNNMQINEQDNSNGNIIYFQKYKSN